MINAIEEPKQHALHALNLAKANYKKAKKEARLKLFNCNGDDILLANILSVVHQLIELYKLSNNSFVIVPYEDTVSTILCDISKNKFCWGYSSIVERIDEDIKQFIKDHFRRHLFSDDELTLEYKSKKPSVLKEIKWQDNGVDDIKFKRDGQYYIYDNNSLANYVNWKELFDQTMRDTPIINRNWAYVTPKIDVECLYLI
jgi:hypothetical protein